jgi:hypothetical protein
MEGKYDVEADIEIPELVLNHKQLELVRSLKGSLQSSVVCVAQPIKYDDDDLNEVDTIYIE